jgi:hypothetical protein
MFSLHNSVKSCKHVEINVEIEEYDVFISYSIEDRTKADELYEILCKKHNLKVWMNKLDNKYCHQAEVYIEQSKCFVSLITKDYVESQSCCNEFKLGKFYKKEILLALYENVALDECSNFGFYEVDFLGFNLYENKKLFDVIDELLRIVLPDNFSVNEYFSPV